MNGSLLQEHPPRILFVAAEAAPFVKVGGLGEVMRVLPRALRNLGYDARVMIPKYATMNLRDFSTSLKIAGMNFVPKSEDPNGLFISNVLEHRDAEGGITYFFENMEYFEKRANVYGYTDDPIRWWLFTKGVLEFLLRSEWRPEIIVVNDWQTGFLPDFLARQYREHRTLASMRTMFVIHNMVYQGMFDHRFVAESNTDDGHGLIPDPHNPRLLHLNGLRRGILHADAVVTVSPTYAKEILTPDFGEGLHDLLREKSSRLFGILNGIDYKAFDPRTDRAIPARYTLKSLWRRSHNKPALQERFGLDRDPSKFVIGIVSRMDEQKGFELLMEVAQPLFSNVDFQMVVVGEGDNEYRLFFQNLEKKYPGRLGGHYFFDASLPRLVFAGADAVLAPSKFEPCGLVQMEAMRYGAVPIVRKTGGLADSVEDFDGESGNGFVFEKFDPFALLVAVTRAREQFSNKKNWMSIVRQGMSRDFSWEQSAREYAQVIERALLYETNAVG